MPLVSLVHTHTKDGDTAGILNGPAVQSTAGIHCQKVSNITLHYKPSKLTFVMLT